MTDLEFHDEALGDALSEWLREGWKDDLTKPEHEKMRQIVTGCFKDGWGACLQTKLGPAFDLALLFTRAIGEARQRGGENATVVLDAGVLVFVEKLCEALLGNVDLVALREQVEMVNVMDMSDEERTKAGLPPREGDES